MQHSIPSIFSVRVFLVALAAAGLSACGGSSGGSGGELNGAGSSEVGGGAVQFSMRLQGAPVSTQAMATKFHESSDDAGTVIDLTDVRINVRDVEFYLPEGIRCEDVQFTFVSPVRCDVDDENETDDSIDDDDGTPDQGPGDLLKASESGDDDVGDDDPNGGDDGERDGDDHEDKVVLEGPFIVDLIAGTTTPVLTDFLIPAGNYTRIDVRIDDSEALGGYSLVAAGTFEYQGAVHILSLALRFNEDIRFENEKGIAVAESGANDIILMLDESSWFGGVNLTRCLDEGNLEFQPDGTLVIQESSDGDECGDIENRIRDNIESSGEVIEDDDSDEDDSDDDSDSDSEDSPDEGNDDSDEIE